MRGSGCLCNVGPGYEMSKQWPGKYKLDKEATVEFVRLWDISLKYTDIYFLKFRHRILTLLSFQFVVITVKGFYEVNNSTY